MMNKFYFNLYSKRKKIGISLALIIFIISIGFYMIKNRTQSINSNDAINSVSAKNNGEINNIITTNDPTCSDEDGLTHAEIESEYFIKPLMKYPEEVNFKGDRRGHKTDENSYLVFEKFTAKNAIGVKTEYVYKIDMHYNGGDWTDNNNWEYNTAIIEDTSTGEQHTYYGGK